MDILCWRWGISQTRIQSVDSSVPKKGPGQHNEGKSHTWIPWMETKGMVTTWTQRWITLRWIIAFLQDGLPRCRQSNHTAPPAAAPWHTRPPHCPVAQINPSERIFPRPAEPCRRQEDHCGRITAVMENNDLQRLELVGLYYIQLHLPLNPILSPPCPVQVLIYHKHWASAASQEAGFGRIWGSTWRWLMKLERCGAVRKGVKSDWEQ